MRYSDVVRQFYRIELCPDDEEMLDTYFTGAAHHFYRALEASKNVDPYSCEFHLERYRLHLMNLRGVVFRRGNFANAMDESLRGLEKRSNWSPGSANLVDPDMFQSMKPDPNFDVGDEHPADAYVVPSSWGMRLSC